MIEYRQLRKTVSRIIPGSRQLFHQKVKVGAVREKGRKSNYTQFNLLSGEWQKRERLLDTEEINSFLEISLRAAACPMPLNIDVYDGLRCPFSCIYCYADSFRASLYTSFFDNPKHIGIRHCNPDYYKRELDKLQPLRGQDPHLLTGVRKAFAMEIPVRFGIRFEDFLKVEEKLGISLSLLRYFKETAYPVMINTKSSLVGRDEYVRALAENPAGAAVHITLLTTNDNVNKDLEPGAPPYQSRMDAARALASAGVRVVMRIEPFLFLINDHPDEMLQYIQDMKAGGIRNITFDTYSYSALNPGVRQNFINRNYDFDRIFLAGCDSQMLGSILLGAYMNEFRRHGISCSTFDLGNVPSNDQDICCEVGDYFKGGWNYGSVVLAIRYIAQRAGQPVTWAEFQNWVNERGGFLSPELEQRVHELWNMEGDTAYSIQWAQGLVPVGWDEGGLVWTYIPDLDQRQDLLESLVGGTEQ